MLSEITMFVIVMLPQLVTEPLTVFAEPIGTVSQSFVTVRQGFTQMAQVTEVVFVTEAFGPPMAVMSVPRTVMLFVAACAQVSASVGAKLPLNPIAWPGLSVSGWISGKPLVSKSPAPSSGRLSTTVTLVSRMSPQLVTYPVKSIFAPAGKQVGLFGGYAQIFTT